MTRATLSLNFMHCMERFATRIYLTQRGAFKDSAVVEKLAAASANEAGHVARLKNRIHEVGSAVIPAGSLFQFMGIVIGWFTRLLGRRRLLAVDIWVEKRAVADYGGFLKKVNFDAATASLIQSIIEEEHEHIRNWKTIRQDLAK